MYSRRILTQRLWKVVMVRPLAFLGTSSETRSFISLAALLVKVSAKIHSGGIPRSKRWAIRTVITRVLPLPAPAKSNTGLSVKRTACRWGSLRSERFKDMREKPKER